MMNRSFGLVLVTVFASAGVLYACSDDTSTPAAPSSSSSSSSSGGSTTSSNGSTSSSGGNDDAGVDAAIPEFVGDGGTISTKMNFFVTSRNKGQGGDLRGNPADADGLAGADAFCKELANAVSPILGARNWKAYLSTSAVDARSRIGNGPFYNAKGTLVADDVAHLHDEGGKTNMLSGPNSLTEDGAQVPNDEHDIITGTLANGTKAADTCSNWTVSNGSADGNVGHSNRSSGGIDMNSWNAAHPSNGCSNANFDSTGGRGSMYCFAVP